jgi:hypothetical protein
MGSTKSIKVDSSDNIYGLVGEGTIVVKLDSSGTETWNTGSTYSGYGQMNDLVIAADGTGLVMTGH